MTNVLATRAALFRDDLDFQMMKITKIISNNVHRLTWLPVSSKCLIVTLPQNEEINHIWHVVIPVQEISVALMRENNKHRVVDEYISLKKKKTHSKTSISASMSKPQT